MTLIFVMPMDADSKKYIPFPLFILILIIIFFIGLIYSYFYFQTRLQQVNSSNQEIVNSIEIPIKTISFGIDSPQASVNYLTELSRFISLQLNAKAIIKQIPQNNGLKYLDSGQVDVIVTTNLSSDQNYQKYNYSDDFINTDQLLITKTSNKQLQADVNYALSSLLIHGIVSDLKQKFLN
jgi:hypothetical protein